MNRSRVRRILSLALTYVGIVTGTLVVVDLVTIALGLFPPSHNYGDPDLGWRAAAATGQMQVESCVEFSTQERITYERNEDGVRTHRSVEQLRADTVSFKIAVTGDSQTDLCAPNAETHAGVLETELAAHDIPALVFAAGAGKYSPLQGYLAYMNVLRPYGPHAFVLNFYTGNDLYDLLRADDRPHFISADTGYRIAQPIWFEYDDPDVRRRSRVLFALRSLASKTGMSSQILRVRLLTKLAAEQGGRFRTVLAYMNDLRQAREPTLGYPEAFAAQLLNQQLFFHHFPNGRDESLRRVRILMELVRRENSEVLLVMSPLPSYQLAGRRPVGDPLYRTLDRLPITHSGGVREEEELYEALRSFSNEMGWLFVDNLAALRAYNGSERLYNDFDYHLLPVASAIVGSTQAAVIREHLQQRHLNRRRKKGGPGG